MLQPADHDPPPLAAVREGLPLVAALAVAGVAGWRRSRATGAALLALAAWCAWFFRDPRRRCPAAPGVLYAPADGTVTAVDEVEWDWGFRGRALRVVVFLSILDVHVNRSPAAGRLVAARRDPGGFAPAFLLHGSEANARQLLCIEVDGRPPQTNRLVVAQVVGIMARRIVSWRLPGDRLAAGQKLGMIRFGSRTDLLVPAASATALVRPGDTVRAGISPVARYL